MAGIGFELKKILQEDSWACVFKAYAYAGALGSGAWILSVLGILLVSMMGITDTAGIAPWVSSFQVSVTWVMSASLVTSGLFQLVFTRYIADCLYLDNTAAIIPGLFGASALVTLSSVVLGSLLAIILAEFTPADWPYLLLMLINYVLLCNIWILVVFVAGLRQYRRLLLGFFIAYAVIVVLAGLVPDAGVVSKLTIFFIGHGVLLVWLFRAIMQEYGFAMIGPDISYQFLRLGKVCVPLLISGLFLNLGIWVDKWLFWIYPDTSVSIAQVLRASPVHDPSIFIAYLAMIPGMASFLLRIETDFVVACQAYYRALSSSSLSRIEALREDMQLALTSALTEVVKVQGVTMLVVWLLAENIAEWLGWPPEYAGFLRIDVCATSLLVCFIALLNIIFYFNFLKQAVWMTLGLFILNAAFSLLSLLMGPAWYGAGFALALLVVCVLAGLALSAKIKRLEYQTFMLQ